MTFRELLCWFNHTFVWKLQRIESSSKFCKFLFCKLCKINISRTKSQIINYIIIWIFFEDFSCWPKHGFICRLQRIEFLDIVFYYSSPSHVLHSADWCSANCRTWDGEVTEPEISIRGAWSKWLNPPNIYGIHWHSVTKTTLLLSKIRPCQNSTQDK